MSHDNTPREELRGYGKVPMWMAYTIAVVAVAFFFVAFAIIAKTILAGSEYAFLAVFPVAGVCVYCWNFPAYVATSRAKTWLPFGPSRVTSETNAQITYATSEGLRTSKERTLRINGSEWSLADNTGDDLVVGDIVTGQYLNRDRLVRNLTKVGVPTPA